MTVERHEAWKAWANGSTSKRKTSLDRHVAIDLDDVVLDFTGGVRSAIRTEYGVDIPPFPTWDMAASLNPVIGYSWWTWMRSRDWLWKTFPAVEGAIGGIAKLRTAGYYLEIVTSKPDWAEASVWQWLGRWRPAVHRVTVVGDKAVKADFTDARILVDDKPKNCEEWVASREDRIAILFSRSHNQEAVYRARVLREESWAGVVAAIAEVIP